MLQLLEVPVNDILDNPDQPRKTITPEEIAELANDIKNNGLLQPIAIREYNTQYMIIFGTRRLAAVKSLGHDVIQAQIFPNENGLKLLLTALAENIQRQPLSDWEEAESLRILRDGHKLGVRELGRLINKDKASVSRRLKVIEEPDLVEAIKDGKIATSTAALMINTPIEERKEMIRNGVKQSDVVKAIQQKNKQVAKPPVKSNYHDDVDDDYDDDIDDAVKEPERMKLTDIFDSSKDSPMSMDAIMADLFDSCKELKEELVINHRKMDTKCWQALRECIKIIMECMKMMPTPKS